MLRWMSVNIPRDWVGNECMHKKVEVSSIEDTTREGEYVKMVSACAMEGAPILAPIQEVIGF